jgi:hypothetical protein
VRADLLVDFSGKEGHLMESFPVTMFAPMAGIVTPV